jgi:hypothetical protein
MVLTVVERTGIWAYVGEEVVVVWLCLWGWYPTALSRRYTNMEYCSKCLPCSGAVCVTIVVVEDTVVTVCVVTVYCGRKLWVLLCKMSTMFQLRKRKYLSTCYGSKYRYLRYAFGLSGSLDPV